MIQLTGIFPPITTPFDDSGKILYSELESNLELWNDQSLSGYVVGGSNGEFVSLSVDERVEVVRRVRQMTPNSRLVIAGSGMHATAAAISLTGRLADVGADAALVLTPSYYKSNMTTPALVAYYEQIAGNSSIPILLYNVPRNTGLDLPLEVVETLSDHENICGIKDSSGDVTKIGAMVGNTREDFQVLAGSAGFLLGALSVGAVGAVSALANIAGPKLVSLIKAFQEGDLKTAKALQIRLIEPNTAVTARFGVPGLKAALDMIGFYGGPARLPLLPLSDTEKAELGDILARANLI